MEYKTYSAFSIEYTFYRIFHQKQWNDDINFLFELKIGQRWTDNNLRTELTMHYINSKEWDRRKKNNSGKSMNRIRNLKHLRIVNDLNDGISE